MDVAVGYVGQHIANPLKNGDCEDLDQPLLSLQFRAYSSSLGERLFCKQEAVCSSQTRSTKFLARNPGRPERDRGHRLSANFMVLVFEWLQKADCESVLRGFESRQAPQFCAHSITE